MAFNYKLLGQVKQACIKLAAPVPPEEVTAPKPYVKPPELEPQQPKVIPPSERIIADSKKLEDLLNKPKPFQMQYPSRPKDMVDPIELRTRHKIPPDADLSAYPEAQKEWLKRFPEREAYYDKLHLYESKGDPLEYDRIKKEYMRKMFVNPLNYEYYKWNAHHEPTTGRQLPVGNINRVFDPEVPSLREEATELYNAAHQSKLRRFN